MECARGLQLIDLAEPPATYEGLLQISELLDELEKGLKEIGAFARSHDDIATVNDLDLINEFENIILGIRVEAVQRHRQNVIDLIKDLERFVLEKLGISQGVLREHIVELEILPMIIPDRGPSSF